MITLYLSLIVALIGLLMYLLLENKASEIGRILFFACVLAYLMKG